MRFSQLQIGQEFVREGVEDFTVYVKTGIRTYSETSNGLDLEMADDNDNFPVVEVV